MEEWYNHPSASRAPSRLLLPPSSRSLLPPRAPSVLVRCRFYDIAHPPLSPLIL